MPALTAIVVLALAAAPADTTTDPHGWRYLKWGMAEGSAEKAVLKNERGSFRAEKGAALVLVTPHLSLGPADATRLHLSFHAKRLWSVEVFLAYSGDDAGPALRKALKEKYGEPLDAALQAQALTRMGIAAEDQQDHCGGILDIACWLVGDTLVALESYGSASLNGRLRYEDVKGAAAYWAAAEAKAKAKADASKL